MPRSRSEQQAGADREVARTRVWRAAVELFAAKGFHGTGIRELADAAGLSSASLYHYMGSKDDLLFGIMRHSLLRLGAAAERVSERTVEPGERIAGLVHVHVLSHALYPDETAVVDHELRALGPEHRKAAVALRDSYEDYWRRAVADGCDTGLFHAPERSVVRIALLEMCSAVAGWYAPGGPLGLDEIAAAHARMALAALGAPPEAQCAPFVADVSHARRLVEEIWQVALPPGRA